MYIHMYLSLYLYYCAIFWCVAISPTKQPRKKNDTVVSSLVTLPVAADTLFLFPVWKRTWWAPSWQIGEVRPHDKRRSAQLEYVDTNWVTDGVSFGWYCWWKNYCTTWDVKKLVNDGINYPTINCCRISSIDSTGKGRSWVEPRGVHDFPYLPYLHFTIACGVLLLPMAGVEVLQLSPWVILKSRPYQGSWVMRVGVKACAVFWYQEQRKPGICYHSNLKKRPLGNSMVTALFLPPPPPPKKKKLHRTVMSRFWRCNLSHRA